MPCIANWSSSHVLGSRPYPRVKTLTPISFTVVAPINRAVDDKAAKSLLGESFKRQLKMDGGFSAVTFICSKTDDISISEAQDSLGLEDKMTPSWDELDRLSAKKKDLKKDIDELKKTKTDYDDVANDVDEQIDVWEVLQESVINAMLEEERLVPTNCMRACTVSGKPP